MTGPAVVLAVWQQVNGRELGDRRKAEFLAHPALDDLTAFSAEILAETGRRLRDEHGELLLIVRAAECAEPGLTGLPPSGELGLSLARTAGVVRALVAALAGAVRSDSDRAVLQRRLGTQMRSAAVRPGYRSARDQARARLTTLVTGEDGTPDGGMVRAGAARERPADR